MHDAGNRTTAPKWQLYRSGETVMEFGRPVVAINRMGKGRLINSQGIWCEVCKNGTRRWRSSFEGV